MCSKSVVVVFLGLCLVVLVSTTVWCAPEVKVTGFVQARYVSDEADSVSSTFAAKRARVTFDTVLTPQSAVRAQLEATGTPVLLDAYCALTPANTNLNVRLGQFKVPISYEVLEPISALLERELSEAWVRLVPKSRDSGAHLLAKGKNGAASWDLALINGNGVNRTDNNQHKDLVIREVVPFRQGTAEIAYYTGEFTEGGATTVRSRLVGGADARLGPVALRGEYVRGRDLGKDVSGGFLRVSGKVGRKGDIAFAKYDLYDEDLDAPNTTFQRYTLGYAHELDPQTRLTAVYQIKDVDSGYSDYSKQNGNVLLLECQMSFGG
jgi:hypothetical protein